MKWIVFYRISIRLENKIKKTILKKKIKIFFWICFLLILGWLAFLFELNCQACVIILAITGQGCLVFRFWILVACNCLILWRGLRYKFMQTIWFLYAKHMQARGVYEFYMHEHNLFLNIIVELRRNTVEIVLDFLCKKYTLGINLVYCAANSNFQCWKT